MSTLRDFSFEFEQEPMIQALAAALANTRNTLEEEAHEGEAIFEQDAVCVEQH